MPVIKVWGLPDDLSENDLLELYEKINNVVVSVKGLNLSKEDLTILFPADRMKYGLGDEIIIEISGFFQKHAMLQSVFNRLAESVGETVKHFFSNTEKVECLVHPFNQNDAFWSSVDRNIHF